MTARGFPAFPAGPARRIRSAWATGWAAVLAESALDAEPVRRGRRLAARGHVGPITISPGRIAASVHDGDPEQAHRTVLRVDTLPDADWDRLATAVADRSGHLAALLAGQLPAELPEFAGVRLPPTGGQLLPDCDCPDWGHPCRHAAALCHQVTWLLEGEPLLLLLIRGRDAADLLADVRPPTLAATTTVDRPLPGPEPSDAGSAHGTPADEAYAATPGPLPGAPDGPVTVTLPLLPADPGVDVDALRRRIALGAARAAALLDQGRSATRAPASGDPGDGGFAVGPPGVDPAELVATTLTTPPAGPVAGPESSASSAP
ncbi:SWIM zinc finger family protein [Micromonospora sp. NPDC050200]|uniref:SWIM zinc finger family protein n=1 Tax=Micromonospora sp. NPDC050200 TaxID=3155664 RepID=UPI0033CAB270